MNAAFQVQPITARPIQRPAFVFAPSFDAWFELNRRAVSNYSFEVAMACIDDDVEPVGFRTFACGLYIDERSRRGLPLHEEA